jgi:hypothetical protein
MPGIDNKWVQFALSFVMAGTLGASWASIMPAATAASIVGVALAVEGTLHLTRKPS